MDRKKKQKIEEQERELSEEDLDGIAGGAYYAPISDPYGLLEPDSSSPGNSNNVTGPKLPVKP